MDANYDHLLEGLPSEWRDWPEGVWIQPEYAAADAAYTAAMVKDVNSHMSALSSAVDAAIAVFLARTLRGHIERLPA